MNDMLNEYVLTFDIDWSPDYVIDNVAQTLINKGIKATWFVTHDSPGIRKLLEHNDIFEFGLHPNFLPHTSQGSNENEVMDYCTKLLPDSKIIRTHALFQSTYLLRKLVKEYQIEIDVSLFLPETPNLQPHMIRFDSKNKELTRVPYFWEDDIELYNSSMSLSIKNPKYHVNGLKVFDFHPILIFLNSDSMHDFESLKKEKPLYSLEENIVKDLINCKSVGVKNFFDELCDEILDKQKTSYTISEIVKKWKS